MAIDVPDFAGFTPLIGAAFSGNLPAVKLLLAKGANVNAVSGDGSFQKVKAGTIALGNWTPLLAAASLGSPEMIAVLLDAGADVNARDVRGMTPLMLAVATDRQNPDVVRSLLDRKADVNVRSLAGETALDWARKIGNPSVVRMLERAGAVASTSPAAVPATFAPADTLTAVRRSLACSRRARPRRRRKADARRAITTTSPTSRAWLRATRALRSTKRPRPIDVS